ncbi:uncharacterized protein [Oscarella lobularis]|uniref:uncharacterized protein n=1 Tax=Oscarella lobularis TaxID=121494 RepID=UPI00331449D0
MAEAADSRDDLSEEPQAESSTPKPSTLPPTEAKASEPESEPPEQENPVPSTLNRSQKDIDNDDEFEDDYNIEFENDDQDVNKIPSPPPLPPLPTQGGAAALDEDHDVEVSSSAVAGSQQPFAEVMAGIKRGVDLKRVPEEEKRRSLPGRVKVVDVQSELRMKFGREKAQKIEKMKSQVDRHQDRIDKVKQWILEAEQAHLPVYQLRKLLSEIRDVQQIVQVTPELMTSRISWPSHLIEYIETIVDVLTSLERDVFKLEDLVKNAQEADEGSNCVHLNVDVAWSTVDVVIVKVKSMAHVGSRYSQASVNFTVSSSDVGSIVGRARQAATGVLDLLLAKGFNTAETIHEPGLRKFDQNFRVSSAHRLLQKCCQMNDSIITHLHGEKHSRYSEMRLKLSELEQDYGQVIKVARRSGNWDEPEQVVMRSSGSQTSTKGRGVLMKISQFLRNDQPLEAKALLSEVTKKDNFMTMEKALILAALESSQVQAVDVVLEHRRSLGLDQLPPSKQFDVINDGLAKGKKEGLKRLIQVHNFNVDSRSSDAGNTALHVAARRANLQGMVFLIELGADPMIVNPTSSMTPLQLLAIKEFSRVVIPSQQFHSHLNLSSYLRCSNLSDVTLVAEEEDGNKKLYPAHRIVLCAQSDVFRAMMDSEHWKASKNQEILLPDVSPAVLEKLLEYLYNGSCLFPKDDLNLGVGLLVVADRYLLKPMAFQCESQLSDMISIEVVVPLYHAAHRLGALGLLQNCCHFILNDYKTINDSDFETLLHLLQNVVPLDDTTYRR